MQILNMGYAYLFHMGNLKLKKLIMQEKITTLVSNIFDILNNVRMLTMFLYYFEIREQQFNDMFIKRCSRKGLNNSYF